jgi:hypothetical protein
MRKVLDPTTVRSITSRAATYLVQLHRAALGRTRPSTAP